MVDDLWNRVETLLNGEGVLVVDGSEEVGGFSCGEEIGCAREADSERVQAGPIRERRVDAYAGWLKWAKRHSLGSLPAAIAFLRSIRNASCSCAILSVSLAATAAIRLLSNPPLRSTP